MKTYKSTMHSITYQEQRTSRPTTFWISRATSKHDTLAVKKENELPITQEIYSQQVQKSAERTIRKTAKVLNVEKKLIQQIGKNPNVLVPLIH